MPTIPQNNETYVILWTGNENLISADLSLEKPKTSVTYLILLLGNNRKVLNLTLNFRHKAFGTKSNVVIKGILTDETIVNINYSVIAEKGARKAEISLSSEMLSLSDRTEVKLIPNVKKYANDSKLKQLFTVDPISSFDTFYLQSKGLPQARAKELIVRGFLSDLIDQMPYAVLEEIELALSGFKI